MERSIHVNADGSVVLAEDDRELELPDDADVETEAAEFFTPVEPE